MKILDKFLAPKTALDEKMEDEIVVTDGFAAVFDGCTRRSADCWGGDAPGRVAIEQLSGAMTVLSARMNIAEVVETLTQCLANFYQQRGLVERLAKEPQLRPAATAAVYSRHRREVWLVGDCQCRIGQVVHQPRMHIDDVLAVLRSMEIHRALLSGRTEQEVKNNDCGRTAIAPFQERQCVFQNVDADCPFGYGVLDGFPVPRRYLHVHAVPHHVSEIVLASDGYPHLEPTLAASEQALATLLAQDPLLYRRFKATKGVSRSGDSFDDRAYLRLKLD